MAIEAELRKKLTESIRSRDLRTANVIRMVNTRVMERRTSKGFSGEVDDELYREVIGAYKRSLEKARKDFEGAGDRGAEQLAELDFEIRFLGQYLPAEMSADEVRTEVRAVLAELGAVDPKQSGRVVGAVMKKHKGRVNAALVKQIVDEELG